jgi:hypothetical protein
VVRDHLAHVPFVEVGPLKHIQLIQFFLVVRVWSTRGGQTPQESANGFMLSVISVCSFISHTMGQTRGICRTLEIKMKKTTQVLCCAVLGFGATLMPSKAKAATDADKKFLAMAAQSDQNEIALSQLAEQKATNPAVKAFAEKMA